MLGTGIGDHLGGGQRQTARGLGSLQSERGTATVNGLASAGQGPGAGDSLVGRTTVGRRKVETERRHKIRHQVNHGEMREKIKEERWERQRSTGRGEEKSKERKIKMERNQLVYVRIEIEVEGMLLWGCWWDLTTSSLGMPQAWAWEPKARGSMRY